MNKEKKFLIVSTVTQKMSDEEAFVSIREVKFLIETYGGTVIDIVIQNREVHDKGMYIGTGKIVEIGELIREKEIDVVVLNSIVIPGQIYEIHKILYGNNKKIQVWDRVDLILKIFASHAHTAEARLQIELAAMRHMGPRIYGMGKEMSQQGGGIGTRGIGETNTELMKRHWRAQMKIVYDKQKKLAKDRERQLERREKIGFKTVSIIGYTNAGKTSLYNVLTLSNKVVNDALFVTLDSTTSKVKLPISKEEILVADTIGFIQNLPPELIDAFKSTLLESIHADLLLHVIDASDEDFERKIKIVDEIIFELEVADKTKILVFNKIDAITKEKEKMLKGKYQMYNPVFLSVKKKEGIHELLTLIEKLLKT